MAWRSALSRNLQELRDFVHSSYQELKKANPTFPILIRECSGVQARMIARYDYGVEEAVSIDGIDKSAIFKKLEELVKKGETMEKYALPTHLGTNLTDFQLANAEKVASSRPVRLTST